MYRSFIANSDKKISYKNHKNIFLKLNFLRNLVYKYYIQNIILIIIAIIYLDFFKLFPLTSKKSILECPENDKKR